MSVTVVMQPAHEATVTAIRKAVEALPLERAAHIGDDLGIDTETPYNDGTDLTAEDIAVMVESRLMDVLLNAGLAHRHVTSMIGDGR